jgi:hypothetical protein
MPASRLIGSAVVGGQLLLALPALLCAQMPATSLQPIGRVASFAPGSISGFVQDEDGTALKGAVVSALGSTTTFAVTDENGRFELRTLAPGPYLVRAHMRGFNAPRAQMVEVRSSARATSSLALRRAGAPAPILAAGFGGVQPPESPPPLSTAGQDDAEPADSEPVGPADRADLDSHDETAWRLRHTRRGILKDVTMPLDVIDPTDPIGNDQFARGAAIAAAEILGWAVASPARAATNFFVDTAFSGQVNLLTTGSFDAPRELFSGAAMSRGIAYMSVGAPAGQQADWNVSGAFTQSDIASWIVAGGYATRLPATHRYDIGMSYSTQRYDGGNPLALRDVKDGSRNVGTVYGYDTFTISPAVSVTYGGRYSHYDYLENRRVVSPRVEATITPADRLRISGLVSRRAHAPGAEEFLPPGDTGIWLPPQRTFSSLASDRSLEAERTLHTSVQVERDFSGSTISLRAFRQHIEDQLVTLFGTDMPSQPSAKLGHYLVGNIGEGDAVGYGAGFRTLVAGRVHGAIDYSVTRATLTSSDELSYLVLMAPSILRSVPDRIHDVSTSVETTVPETATRVLVLYRVSNAFARAKHEAGSLPGFDSRFDVQVRQSLPFMNFSNAKWEMLVAIRNFFREGAVDQSVYDELLVVQPPKRIVGGVTLHF